ncbi:GIY-YIG nuclease family protein [Candidatus Saccharibacteria bacterium]|nr:GIY-YIG nuclease family protein [Candidatus Saccharibacteria bacterium]
MNYFYILKSIRDNKHYFGSTDDLQRRVFEHQKGLVASTKSRMPLDLIYYEAYQSLEAARLRERQVKNSGSARRALFKRINSGP